MTGVRSALIVACDGYSDPGLQRLRAPASDARALAGVLKDPAIGGFAVRTLLNEPAHEVTLAVEEFFADRVADDLLLLHLSCHGVKDEDGELYFAMANTALRRLAATGVAADFVNRRMNRSRSRRVVLLLDCCYAGAFERGMTARAGTGVGIESQFGGRGRAVITASSAMEYAFEGYELADANELAPSVFTSALVEGLETGDADRDQDGVVALDELYDYIYDKVRTATPNQTPGKWTFGVQGELVIARRARPVTHASPLPPELQEAIDSPLAAVRGAAVQELSRLLRGKHAGRSLAARQALEELTRDDSRSVAAAAAGALTDQPEDERPVPGLIPEAPPRLDVTAAVIESPAPIAAPEPTHAAEAAEPGAAAEQPEWAEVAESAAGQADSASGLGPEPEEPVLPQRSSPIEVAKPGAASIPADSGAALPDRDDWLFKAAGIVAIAAGVLLVMSLFGTFVSGFRLADRSANTWQNVILAAAVVVAGCLLIARPTRRLIGPAFLLGAIASVPIGPVYDLIVGHAFPPIGPALWVHFTACVVLTVAGCAVWRALARQRVVHARRRMPAGVIPWLVVLVGCAGAVVLILQVMNEETLPGSGGSFAGRDLLALIWAATMALLVPAVAAIAVPTKFSVALLGGWLISGFSEAVFYADPSRSLFGLTLLALLALTVALAATAPPAPAAIETDTSSRAT